MYIDGEKSIHLVMLKILGISVEQDDEKITFTMEAWMRRNYAFHHMQPFPYDCSNSTFSIPGGNDGTPDILLSANKIEFE